MTWLTDYYFSEDGMFVIPVEHLSRDGLTDDFRSVLRERASLPAGWTELFEDAFRAYWTRTAELSAQTSMYWFPPRVQNVCVVTDPLHVRPYFQPFYKSAWLLYASDFDPAESNVEFGAFQFLQAERMGVLAQWRSPDWFKEGMAYSLSRHPPDGLAPQLAQYRDEFEHWYRQVGKAGLWAAAREF